METQKHSRLGVVSLVLGATSAVSVFVTFLLVGEEMLGGIKAAPNDSMGSMGEIGFFFVMGIFGFFLVGLSMLSIVFGIAGIRAKERKRGFAVWGLALSVVMLLISVGVFRHPLMIASSMILYFLERIFG
jgi:hypothetical protein